MFENYTDRLILANHSLKQLNIIDDSRYVGRMRSVGAMLNCCMTTMGKRRFIYNLNNPTTNRTTLNNSYAITEHLLTYDAWGGFRQELTGVKDIEKFNRKLVIGKVSPKDFSVLCDDLKTIGSLHDTTREDKCVTEYIHDYEKRDISLMCGEMRAELESVFDMEKCSQVDDVSVERLLSLPSDTISFINKGISEPIDNLMKSCLDSRAKFEAVRHVFSDMVKGMEKNSKTDAFIKIHETPKTDASLVGTARRIKLLESRVVKKPQGLTISYESSYSETTENFVLNTTDLKYETQGSNKKDLIVTNSQIRQIATDIRNSKDRLVNEIILFYRNFTNDFSKYNEHMEGVVCYATIVDMLQCKCYVAHRYNYCNQRSLMLRSQTCHLRV